MMPDLRPRTGICRSETALKRQEKADGRVWADQAFGETYAQTACLQAFRGWRDPDSNRGQHDFQQLLAPDDRTGPRPSDPPVRTEEHSAHLALRRRAPGHECGNHAGASDLRRGAVALRLKRARAHGAS